MHVRIREMTEKQDSITEGKRLLFRIVDETGKLIGERRVFFLRHGVLGKYCKLIQKGTSGVDDTLLPTRSSLRHGAYSWRTCR